MENTERPHITVIKWTTHRQVVELSGPALDALIARNTAFGDELRDVDCSVDCWCVKDANYAAHINSRSRGDGGF